MVVIKLVGFLLNCLSYINPKLASKKALQLFATPRKGKLLEHQKEFLTSAKKTVLQYNNLDIATYFWQGQTKPILLAHGWESNSARWKRLINSVLKQNYSIIALDGPAHGASSGKAFNAILYSEFINVVANYYKPYTIIGHSVGGMATFFCMHKYQLDSVKNIISLGAPAHFIGVFKRYVKLLNFNKRISNGMDMLVEERFNNPPSYFSSAKLSEKINANGLFIHDKLDAVIPYNDALLYKTHFKNAKLISTKGYGHSLNSDEVLTHIINFLNTYGA